MSITSRVLAIGVLCFLGTSVLGCGSEPVPTVPAAAPDVVVARLDEHRTLGEPITVENLTVWPVHTDAPLDVGDFLTLEEAEERGVAGVREVGGEPGGGGIANEPAANRAPQQVEIEPPVPQIEVTDDHLPPPRQVAAPARNRRGPQRDVQQRGVQQIVGGGAQVNTLVIENRGDLPILVCAGTIVKGGQQDRQIGQDFVIQANTTVPVDAFCVEPGRWSEGATGGAFSTGKLGVATKAVRSSAQYDGDQSKVWREVGQVLQTAGIQATSTFVAAAEAAPEEIMKSQAETVRRVAEHFARLAKQAAPPVGFAYAVDGKPVTVRIFAHARILEGQIEGFLKAMGMEAALAVHTRGADAVTPPAATADDVVALVKAIQEADETFRDTQAGNRNGYRHAKDGFNGNCYVRRAVGPDTVIITEDWTAR